MPARRRSIEKRLRHILVWYGSRWNASGGLAFNFESDFVKTDAAQDVEHVNDVGVDRIGIAAHEHFGFRILLMNFLQGGRELLIAHLFLIKIWVTIRVDRNADVVALRLRF